LKKKTQSSHRFSKLLLISLLPFFSLISCDQKDNPENKDGITNTATGSIKKNSSESPNFAWSEYVNSNTSGIISKREKARIRFVYDVIPESKLGSSAHKVVSISPKCEFTSRFSDKNEIEIIPTGQFDPGETYTVSVSSNKLLGIPKDLDQFSFRFSVIPSDFDIDLDGLIIKNNDEFILKGRVQTSDFADSNATEDAFKVKQSGQLLEIQWTHSKDFRQHKFTVVGIKPAKKSSQNPSDHKLRIIWDGESLGIDQKGSREIDIPSDGPLKIIGDARSENNQQSVKIFFSQPLAMDQDLTGLVTINNKNASTSIQSNILTIYPKTRVTGTAKIKIYRGIKSKSGLKLIDEYAKDYQFHQPNPGVKFIGKGVILPDYKETLKVPFEAANIDSVQVTAMRIFGDNMGQFLQDNTLDSNYQMNRVG